MREKNNQIIIYGASENGFLTKKVIDKLLPSGIDYFCDNDPKKKGLVFDGVSVISVDELIALTSSRCDMEYVIFVTNNRYDEVVDELFGKVKNSKYWIPIHKPFTDVLECSTIKDFFMEIDPCKPSLDYVECHLSYHCNLKCKGCSHFSNISDPEFPDYEQFAKDIHRLSQLFRNIRKIRLLGGEPLLNTQLPSYIKASRDAFPLSDLRVVSNGLLIPHIKNEILQVMKDYNVSFDITLYPPTDEKKGEIELKLIENEVKYNFSKPVKEFFDLTNNSGDSDPNHSFNICISRNCHFLENGKISVCPRPIIYNKFKEKAKLELRPIDGSIYDIYDLNDGRELVEAFSHPIEYCRFCNNENKRFFKWESER